MKTLINRIRTKTGYGWSCPPCKINAGDPDDPFASQTDAINGLNRHVADSHDGNIQEDSYIGEITWR